MSSSTKNIYDLLRQIDTGYISPPDVVYNDVIIEGNLTVNGGQTILNTITTQLEDSILTLNSTGTGLSTEKSGIEIQRGVGNTNQRLIFDDADDKWKAGPEGSEKILATQNSSLTSGSIVYANSNGDLAQSNANVFYDSTNVRIGLGTNSPISKLHLSYIASGASSGINDIVSATNTPAMSIVMQDTRNYGASSQEYNRGIHWIFNSDQENRYSGSGALQQNLSAISMAYHPFGAYNNAEQGATNIMFYTTSPNSGNTSAEFTEKMRIQYNGNVGIGTTSPLANIHLKGTTSTLDTTITDNTGMVCNSMYKELAFGGNGRDWFVGSGKTATAGDSSKFILLSSDAGGGSRPYIHIGFDSTTDTMFVAGKVRATELELVSSSKGLILNKGTIAGITTPVEGMLIYDTNQKGLAFRDNTAWNYLPKIRTGEVFYNPSSANSSTILLNESTKFFRIPFGSNPTQKSGSIDWDTSAVGFASIKYTGITSSKLATHTLALTCSLNKASYQGNFKVYKNPAFGASGEISAGTEMTSSIQALIFPATVSQKVSISLTFSDFLNTNDVYYICIQTPSASDGTLTGTYFNWVGTAY